MKTFLKHSHLLFITSGVILALSNNSFAMPEMPFCPAGGPPGWFNYFNDKRDQNIWRQHNAIHHYQQRPDPAQRAAMISPPAHSPQISPQQNSHQQLKMTKNPAQNPPVKNSTAQNYRTALNNQQARHHSNPPYRQASQPAPMQQVDWQRLQQQRLQQQKLLQQKFQQQLAQRQLQLQRYQQQLLEHQRQERQQLERQRLEQQQLEQQRFNQQRSAQQRHGQQRAPEPYYRQPPAPRYSKPQYSRQPYPGSPFSDQPNRPGNHPAQPYQRQPTG